MTGILDLLNSDLGKTIVNGVSKESGQPEEKTQGILSMALPVLMQAMKKNADTPEGASGLLGALNKKHDGGILDNLGDLFNGGVNAEVSEDGNNILGHILGNKQPKVEQALSQKSGVDSGSVSKILKVAAPLLMGVLGKETRQQNVSDQNGLSSMLGGLLGGNSKDNEQSFLMSILDADGDGSVIDDVADMVLGKDKSGKKSGGLGGLLGGLFGRK